MRLVVAVVVVASVAWACSSEKPRSTAASLRNVKVELTPFVRLRQPLAIAQRKNDPAFYVAEKNGLIQVVRGSRVVRTAIDIRSEVTAGYEQGLLGLAFAPEGDKLYINFTNAKGDTVIREYGFTRGRVDTGTSRTLLEVDQPFDNHNGGQLLFGPDGYLYIGLGDGGTAKGTGGDPHGNAQDTDKLLGKVLRIDPQPSGDDAYRIPPDNPFAGRPGRDEIWAYGLRNPWRFSFDRKTDDLWIGDVGQHLWEEVDFQPAGVHAARNYGWPALEGRHRYARKAGVLPVPPSRLPVFEYSHAGGNCGIIGGVVYRGSRIPDLRGAYLYADHCTGKVYALRLRGSRVVEHRSLRVSVPLLSSFAEDRSGEVYVTSLAEGVLRLAPV